MSDDLYEPTNPFPTLQATSTTQISVSRTNSGTSQEKFLDAPTKRSLWQWGKQFVEGLVHQVKETHFVIDEDEKRILDWLQLEVYEGFGITDGREPAAEFVDYALGQPHKTPEGASVRLSERLSGVILLYTTVNGQLPPWLQETDMSEDDFWDDIKETAALLEKGEDLYPFNLAIETLKARHDKVGDALAKKILNKKTEYEQLRAKLLAAFEKEIQLYPEEVDLLNNVQLLLSETEIKTDGET